MRADLLRSWRQITNEGGSGDVGQVKAGQNRINSLFAAAARASLLSHQPTLYGLSSRVQASGAQTVGFKRWTPNGKSQTYLEQIARIYSKS